MEMIRTKTELLAYLDSINYDNKNYLIALEGLIFTPEGKIILEKRGEKVKDEVGKLEGVGGGVGEEDDNLHRKLQEEIRDELGLGLEVATIDRLLEVRTDMQFNEAFEKKEGPQVWVVVSYLCRLMKGIHVIREIIEGKRLTPEQPDKVASVHEFTMDELYAISEDKLSNSTIAARKTYKAKYGNKPYYEVPEDAQ